MVDTEFKWGEKRGPAINGRQYYKSFTYRSMKYFLFDSVVVNRTGAYETDIGKIVEIYSRGTKKMVKVVWFLRPLDVVEHLNGYTPSWNELFITSGEGKGVFNYVALESIIGKRYVNCTSEDKRNHMPSTEAEYIFCRHFDVGKKKILQRFPDHIADIDVENYFNKAKNKNLTRIPAFNTALKNQAEQSNVLSKSRLNKVGGRPCKSGEPSSSSILRVKESDKAPLLPAKRKTVQFDRTPESSLDTCLNKKMRDTSKPVPTAKESDKASLLPAQRKTVQFDSALESALDIYLNTKTRNTSKPVPTAKDKASLRPDKTIAVDSFVSSGPSNTHASEKMKTVGSKLPDLDRSRLFITPALFQDRLQIAEESGTLVLLNNLDPSYSSSEVETLVRSALNENVKEAKVPPCPFSNPRYGKAFVIFNSRDAAQSAVDALDRGCLMADGRVVTGIVCRNTLKKHNKASKFFGHLTIQKHWLKNQREEMRDAVATSHFAQPNTIEYDMAMEWCTQQEKSEMCWNALFKKHEEEENEVKKLGERRSIV